MYSCILVPIDGSSTAWAGLDHALTLAQALGSSLQLLYVVDVRRLPAEVTDRATPERLIEAWRLHGQQLVCAAAETIRACGIEVDATVRADPTLRVSDQIVDEARRIGAGLIVMGTHGRRGVRRLALGSDAEAVLRESPVPVLLVRDLAEEAPNKAPLST